MRYVANQSRGTKLLTTDDGWYVFVAEMVSLEAENGK